MQMLVRVKISIDIKTKLVSGALLLGAAFFLVLKAAKSNPLES